MQGLLLKELLANPEILGPETNQQLTILSGSQRQISNSQSFLEARTVSSQPHLLFEEAQYRPNAFNYEPPLKGLKTPAPSITSLAWFIAISSLFWSCSVGDLLIPPSAPVEPFFQNQLIFTIKPILS